VDDFSNHVCFSSASFEDRCISSMVNRQKKASFFRSKNRIQSQQATNDDALPILLLIPKYYSHLICLLPPWRPWWLLAWHLPGSPRGSHPPLGRPPIQLRGWPWSLRSQRKWRGACNAPTIPFPLLVPGASIPNPRPWWDRPNCFCDGNFASVLCIV